MTTQDNLLNEFNLPALREQKSVAKNDHISKIYFYCDIGCQNCYFDGRLSLKWRSKLNKLEMQTQTKTNFLSTIQTFFSNISEVKFSDVTSLSNVQANYKTKKSQSLKINEKN